MQFQRGLSKRRQMHLWQKNKKEMLHVSLVDRTNFIAEIRHLSNLVHIFTKWEKSNISKTANNTLSQIGSRGLN